MENQMEKNEKMQWTLSCNTGLYGVARNDFQYFALRFRA